MDPAEREAWANAMPNIAAEWSKTLADKGEPGAEIIKVYMGKLADQGCMPVRDWSAELN